MKSFAQVALALLALPAVATAQRDTTHLSRAPLFTRRDAWIGVGFATATVALFPLDREVAVELQEPGTQTNRLLRHVSRNVELITSPGALAIGATLYGVGRVAAKPRIADLGLHGTEAIVVSGVGTALLKGLAGRARPFVSKDGRPSDFSLGRGFRSGDYTSFPSGHTTTAFAAAAAVTAETSRWWPRSTWLVAPAMYGGATMVGLSRMYHDRHWASDVALGAAIGTFSGLKVVQYHHSHPGNRVDRWLLGAAPAPGGASVGLTLRF